MVVQQWEYCLLTCTPMTGLDGDGIRISYQVGTSGKAEHSTLHSADPSPHAAMSLLLDELGAEGWELVTYDTTTNRGVFKRPKLDPGGKP